MTGRVETTDDRKNRIVRLACNEWSMLWLILFRTGRGAFTNRRRKIFPYNLWHLDTRDNKPWLPIADYRLIEFIVPFFLSDERKCRDTSEKQVRSNAWNYARRDVDYYCSLEEGRLIEGGNVSPIPQRGRLSTSLKKEIVHHENL